MPTAVEIHIGHLATDKQPRLKTAHDLGELLLHGVSTGLPLLPQRDKLRLTFFLCGPIASGTDCSSGGTNVGTGTLANPTPNQGSASADSPTLRVDDLTVAGA